MIEFPAPAKINLFLHITGRRRDGRHDLQTLFQFVDLEDRVLIRERRDGLIRRKAPTPGVPDERRDLAIRAARCLQQASGASKGADIELRKRIPQGGGLGGGSSDAATVLVALDRLWGIDMGVDRLAELASSLGADVPVFVRGFAAWAEGTGERLFPLDSSVDDSSCAADGQGALSKRPSSGDPLKGAADSDFVLEEPWYLLIFPSVFVSTAGVFNAPSLPRNTPALQRGDFLRGLQRERSKALDRASASFAEPHRSAGEDEGASPEDPWRIPICRVIKETRNDCEKTVRRIYPEVADVLDWLGRATGVSRMSGTGSTVFAPFADRDRARFLARRLPWPWRGEVVKGVNRSSLAQTMR